MPGEITHDAEILAHVKQAKALLAKIPEADRDALTEATILQGISSGDYMAAAVRTRLRLQNENLRLKTRIQRIRERIAAVKLRLMEAKLPKSNKKAANELTSALHEIYGLKA